ncbi:hypothetical protein Cgig2_014553 [Carnegiea gigantea]|uniref:C3H1-type domain-containing protein n=1 Tax=Carnegiea gigantea TaxID=171969 RepID=A0A9Q1QUJ6_9CARY|nr:hypothetical protein Cgig2_014553 [Carnegiea gigantea]
MDHFDSHKPPRSSISASSKNRTEMCRDFRRGECRRGEACTFVHSFADGRNVLDRRRSVGGGGVDRNQNEVNASLPRRSICRFFNFDGTCPYGNQCRFEHRGFQRSEENQDTHRESSAINIEPTDSNVRTNPRFKTRLCKIWMTLNTCGYGAYCTFAHGQAELVQSPSSTGSEFRNSSTAPRTSNEDASPSNTGNQTVEQKGPQKMQWKTGKKIAGIYGDWPGDVD